MRAPGMSAATAPGGDKEKRKFQLEGRDVQMPDPAFIAGLVSEGVSLDDLRRRLESEYPGYTLPDQAFIDRVLSDKQENLGKLRAGLGFTGPDFSFIHAGAEDKVGRSDKYDTSGTETRMSSGDKDITKILSSDNIFLVKAEGAPKGNN